MALRVAGIISSILGACLSVLESTVLRRTEAVFSTWRAKSLVLITPVLLLLLWGIPLLLPVALVVWRRLLAVTLRRVLVVPCPAVGVVGS